MPNAVRAGRVPTVAAAERGVVKNRVSGGSRGGNSVASAGGSNHSAGGRER